MKNNKLSDYPNIVKEWDYSKNAKNPDDYSCGSEQKVWWICDKGHEWQAQIKNRIARNSGCPYCANKTILEGFNDLKTKYPSIANEWNYEKNKGLKPSDVLYGSHYKAWWRDSFGHEWQATIVDRTSKKQSNCPYCAGKKVLKGFNDLKTKYPNVAQEWHPTKNGTLKPSDVMYGSNKNVWWLGKCGHEWNDFVVNRSVGKHGCPYCANRRILIGFNDLCTTHPKIIKEWNYSKNSKKPTDYTYGSDETVWWKCDKNHEWQEKIMYRARSKYNCPYCSGKRILKGFNDLTTTHPDIAKEWHPTKNSKQPYLYRHNSFDVVWWLCEYGHEWQRSIISRTKNNNKCPYCKKTLLKNDSNLKQKYLNANHVHQIEKNKYKNNHKSIYKFENVLLKNNLKLKCPNLAKEWHPTRNGDLKPTDVAYGSDRKVWWLGKCGHEWESSISSRTKGKRNCPYCSNKAVLVGFNDLATTYPEIAKEWHPTRNGYLKPTKVTYGSNRKVWWLGKCGHEWETHIVNRTKNKYGCPYCNNSRVLKGFNDLKTKYPDIALEWHPTKNGNLKPDEFLYGSTKKVWWLGKCGHEWNTDVASRTKDKHGCPYCCGKKVLVGFNDLATTYPEIAKEWHPTRNGNLKPTKVTYGSNRKVWWLGKCGHEWKSYISLRTNRNRSCPYCSNKAVLIGFNDLATTYPEIASKMCKNENSLIGIYPSNVANSSTSIAWWRCEECNSKYPMAINAMVKQSKRNIKTCPKCRNVNKNIIHYY